MKVAFNVQDIQTKTKQKIVQDAVLVLFAYFTHRWNQPLTPGFGLEMCFSCLE